MAMEFGEKAAEKIELRVKMKPFSKNNLLSPVASISI